MVETIAPVVHGDRRGRYWLTIGIHTLAAGAVAAAFGASLAGAGALFGAPWGTRGALGLAVIAVVYAAREAFRLPVPLFDRRRQVPEWWRTFYSPPVAAALYGAGLGIGFLTFLTYGTYVVVSAGAFVSGSPLSGALVTAPFGLARGISVAVAARSTSAAEAALVVDRISELGRTPAPRLGHAVGLSVLAMLLVAPS